MKYLILLCFTFLVGSGFAQDIYNIADGGSFTFSCNAEEVIVTDSDINDGEFGPNELHEITFCLGDIVEGTLQIVISPELYGDIWDVDEDSFLMVYDGPDSDSPLIGSYNTFNDPNGILVATESTCITLVFVSGAGSSGQGFTANIQCETAFQPFSVDLAAVPAFETSPVSDQSIILCFSDTFSVTAITNYPLSGTSGTSYEQSDETSYFNWQMGDGNSYQGFGLTEITHFYSTGSGYQVTLTVLDVEGTIQYNQFFVLQSPRPIFSNIPIQDTLCIGSQTDITGGIDVINQDTVGVAPGTGAILGGGSVSGQEEVFDADPENCDFVYEIPLIIDEFEEGQVLEDINDLFNVCFNVHHTFLGDLELGLVCPNGTDTLILFDQLDTQGACDGMFPGGVNGSGISLGDPYATPSAIGYDYCWNNDPEFGTFSEEDLNMTGSMTAGTYEPEEDFSELLGCELNGEWKLLFKDSFEGDEGVVNSWSLFFNPDINPSTEYYSPIIIEAGWEPNPDIVSTGDTLISVIPSQEGNNAFTFFIEDSFGCTHDTTINVYVRPSVNAQNAIICTPEHTLAASGIPTNNDIEGNGGWTNLDLPDGATIDYEVLGGGVTNITVSDYGIYEFEVHSEECPGPEYIDTAIVDYRPTPEIDLPPSEVLCQNDSLLLYVGDYEFNEDYNEIWTFNGSTIAQGVSSIYADQTGLYSATVSGFCGSATDTTSLQFVNVSAQIPNSPYCGLESFTILGSVDPVGTTSWISPDPNISFSDPASLATTVISSEYGEYEVGIIDDRCPDEPFSFNVTFLEQPEVFLAPQDPVFCPDDELLVTAFTTGYFTGDYTWNVTMDSSDPEDMPLFSMNTNDTLLIPEEQFTPLVTYTLSAEVFGYPCLPASDSIVFLMKACEYYIPNVFTPNGDNRNDVFAIEFLEFYPESSLRIYNRWGNEVFADNNYDQSNDWNGDDLPDGTYFYELLLPFIGKVETGNITIIRGEGAN